MDILLAATFSTSVKEDVEKLLATRTAEYRDYWEKVKGREPPSMDEWYDIVAGEDSVDSDGEAWSVIKDENGNDEAGVAGDWPFLGPVHPSMLEGEIPPPVPCPLYTPEKQKVDEEERQCDEERNEEDREAMDLVMKEVAKSAEETAEALFDITEGRADNMEVDVKPADEPLFPASISKSGGDY